MPNRTTDWKTLSIGVITVSTIITAAMVAVAIVYVPEIAKQIQAADPDSPLLIIAIAGKLSISVTLIAYYAVIVTGMRIMFEPPPDMQRKELVKTGAALIAQVTAVIFFTMLLVFQPFSAYPEPPPWPRYVAV